MPWLWSCHKCHAHYLLGVTRRCLNDGHYFCGGTTVDRFTGKTKRHKACTSEFDYIRWKEFGNWKRNVPGPESTSDLCRKDCEDRCDFPSACHWEVKKAVKKDVGFEFLEPKCLGDETHVSLASTKSITAVQKRTGVYIDKLVKAAEKRKSQIATLLSPIEEEIKVSSTPTVSPSLIDTPLRLPQLNGLGLNFPVMDFSKFKRSLDEHQTTLNVNEPKADSAISPLPQISVQIDALNEDDVNMTDWLSEDATESPPISPRTIPKSNDTPFDFRLEPDHSPEASSADDESPVSPRRNAWDWTGGSVGIALSTPPLPLENGIWDEEMDEEMEDVEMIWGRGCERSRSIDMVARRLSV
ncbi:hypothetical protein MMC28_004956 [Mycoblastus sanguinarius]|nr:hypothetical protein [Mycoblastus sanguinarius]